jgi:hypothetical protein
MVSKEKVSSLVDGDLVEGLDELVDEIHTSEEFREAWYSYHLIGDVLNKTGEDGASLDRFRKALEAEPTVIAPRVRVKKTEAWNPFVRIAASISFVGFLGWYVVSDLSPVEVSVAWKNPEVTSSQIALESAYDEAIADYLAAHNRVAPRVTGPGMIPEVVGESGGN